MLLGGLWSVSAGPRQFGLSLIEVKSLCYNGPMSISLDEVRHVAKLARLQLDEAEILALQGELNALLGHFVDIRGLEVGGIEPQSHAVALQNVWGEDIPEECLGREDVLRNAPLSKAGLFVVPTIIED
jgi:aspartyl/glutamyl-tRNA(Asn/Gln) amidotransferase C subunit